MASRIKRNDALMSWLRRRNRDSNPHLFFGSKRGFVTMRGWMKNSKDQYTVATILFTHLCSPTIGRLCEEYPREGNNIRLLQSLRLRKHI